MSEQPGEAAGTAKPNPVNYAKPWSISDWDPRVIVDANGGTVAMSLKSPFGETADAVSDVQVAAHIVACVNFADFMSTEELDWFMSERSRVEHAQRVKEFEENSRMFHEQVRTTVRRYPGGLI